MTRIRVVFKDSPEPNRANWGKIFPEVVIPGIIIITSCLVASKVAKILRRKPSVKE